ncbi:hypothetical protein EP073_10925 [Geovibrio thiophilus]|uniref:DUF4410 domain-containing protein n=1 Tax=Geovibrio thiophilus TaxID=139438 RepID=A0A3R5V021_9BACT|nr:hypothetical protein [Geovibrio thiophilus]QAR33896.1 hypothetical protein EP073_10925 [Geovibrio thiophilus]
MIKKVLLCAFCAVFLSACLTPKECKVAKNVLIMPADYSTSQGAGVDFGKNFQKKLTDEITGRFKKLQVKEGFEGEKSDLIVRIVLVEYSDPVFTDSLVNSGTGNVEVSVRIFSGKGALLRETYIMRDLKRGTKEDVLKSIVDEAVTFIDKKCL